MRVRIFKHWWFKQEFNHELWSYQDRNWDLSNNSNEVEEKIIDLTNNLKKLKQYKTKDVEMKNNISQIILNKFQWIFHCLI